MAVFCEVLFMMIVVGLVGATIALALYQPYSFHKKRRYTYKNSQEESDEQLELDGGEYQERMEFAKYAPQDGEEGHYRKLYEQGKITRNEFIQKVSFAMIRGSLFSDW